MYSQVSTVEGLSSSWYKMRRASLAEVMMSATSDSGNPRYLPAGPVTSALALSRKCQGLGSVGTATGRGLDPLPTPAVGARCSLWLSILKTFVNL